MGGGWLHESCLLIACLCLVSLVTIAVMGNLVSPKTASAETQGAVQHRSFFFIDEKPIWKGVVPIDETTCAELFLARHGEMLAQNSGGVLMVGRDAGGCLVDVQGESRRDIITLDLDTKGASARDFTWCIIIENAEGLETHTLRVTPDFCQTTYKKIDEYGQLVRMDSHVNSLALVDGVEALLNYAGMLEANPPALLQTATILGEMALYPETSAAA